MWNRYHGSNLRQYILTLMNIVALIYRDKTLGNSIQMAVVKLLILDESESFAPKNKEDKSRISASDMLKSLLQVAEPHQWLCQEGPEGGIWCSSAPYKVINIHDNVFI